MKLQKKKFLKGLTKEQTLAVRHGKGPALVVSGPGSGKTRVITHRIAYLLARGIDPTSIVAVTFTNKAAKEMRSRVRELVGPKLAKKLVCSTFHSYCFWLIRVYGSRGVLSKDYSNWTILDEDQALTLIVQATVRALRLTSIEELKKVIERANHSVYPQYLDKAFLRTQISKIKQQLLSPREWAESVSLNEQPAKLQKSLSLLKSVYEIYRTLLRKQRLLDFDDLLYIVARSFRKNEKFKQSVGSRIRYLLVDEYQDTNAAQFEICEHLSYLRQNIFVVGDLDQSVYSWRGADHTNINKFKDSFKSSGIKTYFLEKNFRSTKPIAAVANATIKYNLNRIEKTIQAIKPGGKAPEHYIFTNQMQEAEVFTHLIKTDLTCDFEPDDITILYRTKVQSRRFEDLFIKNNIPYRVIGSLGFYDRKIIKDALAYVKLAFNKKDDTSFTRVCNYPPRGLGKSAMSVLLDLAEKHNCSLGEVVLRKKYKKKVSRVVGTRLDRFRKILKRIRKTKKKFGAEQAGDHLSEILTLSGLPQYLESRKETTTKKLEENQRRLEHLDELIVSASEFARGQDTEGGSLRAYLNWIALVQQQDETSDEMNKVTLMTCHAAKGLEFKKVYISGCNNWLMPHYMCGINSPFRTDDGAGRSKDRLISSIEEERRLFYVAVTRAEDGLVIGCPLMVSQFADDRWAGLSLFTLESWHALNHKNQVSDWSPPTTEEERRGLRLKHLVTHMGMKVGVELFRKHMKIDKVSEDMVNQTIIENFPTENWLPVLKELKVISNDEGVPHRPSQATTNSRQTDRSSQKSSQPQRGFSGILLR